MKAQKNENETKLTYYGSGALVAIGVSGIVGYYAYQSKTSVNQPKETRYS